jgi:ABC-type phosphate transport system substrate-binding protein
MRRFLAATLLLLALPVRADLALIVNARSPAVDLSPKQAQEIFLGRMRTFPDGRHAEPVDQTSTRAEFYQVLAQRPIEQINAYWARIVFTGQASPPRPLPDDAAVLETVRENENAIGYVDPAHVDKTVRVILLVKTP